MAAAPPPSPLNPQRRPPKAARMQRGLRRRMAGWGLVVLGVVSVVVVGLSSAFQWHYVWGGDTPGRGDKAIGISEGLLFYSAGESSYWYDGWTRLDEGEVLRWRIPSDETERWNVLGLIRCEGTQDLVRIVAWPWVVVMLGAGGLMVWSGHRARKRAMGGMCRGCGYDLRGLAAGAVCPECGKGGRA